MNSNFFFTTFLTIAQSGCCKLPSPSPSLSSSTTEKTHFSTPSITRLTERWSLLELPSSRLPFSFPLPNFCQSLNLSFILFFHCFSEKQQESLEQQRPHINFTLLGLLLQLPSRDNRQRPQPVEEGLQGQVEVMEEQQEVGIMACHHLPFGPPYYQPERLQKVYCRK